MFHVHLIKCVLGLWVLGTVGQWVLGLDMPERPPWVELLDKRTFDRTKQDSWLVEFYAPWCPHCKKAAPHYYAMAKEVEGWRKTRKFTVAQVNCDTDGEICDQNKVTGYPTIFFYHNGQKIQEYNGEPRKPGFLRFAEEMTAKYGAKVAPESDQPAGSRQDADDAGDDEQPVGKHPAHVQAPPPPPPAQRGGSNYQPQSAEEGQRQAVPMDLQAKQHQFENLLHYVKMTGLGKYGKVVDLTTENMSEIASKGGPWLVEFYAPWCSHCQKLEPVVEELGVRMKGQMNIGRVNVDENPELGTRFEIRGFPTFKLITTHTSLEYRGPMTLESLEHFALSAANTAPIRMIQEHEFSRIEHDHEVAVVFVFDVHTLESEFLAFIEAANSWLLPHITGVFASTDPAFNAGPLPAVLVYREGFSQPDRYPNPVSGPSRPEFTAEGVRTFVRMHRYPLLPELDYHNAPDIMEGISGDDSSPLEKISPEETAVRSKRVVVMAMLDPQTAADKLHVLTQIAASMHEKWEAQMHGIQVMMVWLDGTKWSYYLERVFDLQLSDLPRIVFTVPALEEYFALNEHGKPFEFTEQAIKDALDDVAKQVMGVIPLGTGKLHPQSSRGKVVGLLKSSWRRVNNTSRGVLLMGAGLILGCFWWTCCRRPRTHMPVSTKMD